MTSRNGDVADRRTAGSALSLDCGHQQMFNGRPGPARQRRGDQGTMTFRGVTLVAQQGDPAGHPAVSPG